MLQKFQHGLILFFAKTILFLTWGELQHGGFAKTLQQWKSVNNTHRIKVVYTLKKIHVLIIYTALHN